MRSIVMLVSVFSMIWVGNPSGVRLRVDGRPVYLLGVERVELRTCNGLNRSLTDVALPDGTLVLPTGCYLAVRVEGVELEDGQWLEVAATAPGVNLVIGRDAVEGVDMWSNLP